MFITLYYTLHQPNSPATPAPSVVQAPPTSATNTPVDPAQVQQSLPIRVKIPKIHVNAPIDQVGVTQDGAMGQPKGPANAVWYKLGPRPGEAGSAVIAGHYGWRDNIPALFDTLHLLSIGDSVDIVDENGDTISFTVRSLRTYTLEEDATDVFTSRDGVARLNLVTCTGIWNVAKQSYSRRLVVFTEKAD